MTYCIYIYIYDYVYIRSEPAERPAGPLLVDDAVFDEFVRFVLAPAQSGFQVYQNLVYVCDIYLCTIYLSIYLSVCLSIYLSIYLNLKFRSLGFHSPLSNPRVCRIACVASRSFYYKTLSLCSLCPPSAAQGRRARVRWITFCLCGKRRPGWRRDAQRPAGRR